MLDRETSPALHRGSHAVTPWSPRGLRERLLDREQLHVPGSGGVVPQPHPPRAATHLTILNVLLRPPAPWIEGDSHRLAAVWTSHVGLGLEGRRILVFTLVEGVSVVVPHGIVISRRHDSWQSSSLDGLFGMSRQLHIRLAGRRCWGWSGARARADAALTPRPPREKGGGGVSHLLR